MGVPQGSTFGPLFYFELIHRNDRTTKYLWKTNDLCMFLIVIKSFLMTETAAYVSTDVC